MSEPGDTPSIKRLATDAHRVGCTDCLGTGDRRAFLTQTGLATVAVLIGIGMPAGLAAAMVPTVVTARPRVGARLSYPIPALDGVQIDKTNDVILVRWQHAVYAFNLSCPHQNTALHWNLRDAEFQCTKHHSKYRPDGTFISGRATRGMDRFSVVREGDEIVVDVNAMHQNDTDSAGWNSSVVLLAK